MRPHLLLVFAPLGAWAQDCPDLHAKVSETNRRLEECLAAYSRAGCEEEARAVDTAATAARECSELQPASDAFPAPSEATSPDEGRVVDAEVFLGTRRSTGTWGAADQRQGGLMLSFGNPFVVGFFHSSGIGRLDLSDDDGGRYGRNLTVATTEMAFGGRIAPKTGRLRIQFGAGALITRTTLGGAAIVGDGSSTGTGFWGDAGLSFDVVGPLRVGMQARVSEVLFQSKKVITNDYSYASGDPGGFQVGVVIGAVLPGSGPP